MKHTIITLALGGLLVGAAQAAVISINITNTGNLRQIESGESTGVIDTDGWVNLTASDTDVDDTVVDITLSVAPGKSNTARDAGGDGTNGFLALYEAGLRDSTGGTPGDTYLTVADMDAYMTSEEVSTYTIYAYYKSMVTATADDISIGTATNSLTIVDPIGALVSVNDSFVEAGTAGSNYIVFSGLTADSTTIYVNRVDRDALLTGIQIVTVPEPSAPALLGALLSLGLLRRRRRG